MNGLEQLVILTIAGALGVVSYFAPERLSKPARYMAMGFAYYWLISYLFFDNAPAFVENRLPALASGLSNGALYGMIAVGLILIYRTNRIINFAVAAIGVVPAATATLIATTSLADWNRTVVYLMMLPLVLIGGPLIGALVDITIIRRFAQAPRLIVTVATLGIAQILAFVNIYLPIWFKTDEGVANRFFTPFSDMVLQDSNGSTLFTGDYPVAVLTVIVMSAGLAAFFKFTRMGIALRASAENADRASLLGIPVKVVGTVSWALAGLFGAVTIFLRAPLVGVPTNGTLGYTILLFALAPAVMARMESIPIAVAGGLAVGVLEFASVSSTGSADLASAIMLAFILIALLVQRGSLSRAQDSGVSTWQALQEFRPVPSELRNITEVRWFRAATAVVAVGLALAAPFIITDAEIFKLSLLPITAMVAVSLVILTGWAGQISLGQFALVGAGAVTASKMFVDFDGNFLGDFWVTVIAATIVGALVAVVIGLPAVRIQGLYLAVTTLALAGAVQFYFLNRSYGVGQLILPSEDGLLNYTKRPVLWERLDLNPERNFYYFSLVMLALVIAVAWSFRRHRSGRVLIAARDNARGAPAYGINLVRTRLSAFAVAGGIAGFAGAMLSYQQLAIDASTYGIFPSVRVFVATVMGGLTSLPGAVVGAVGIESVRLFGDPRIDGISLLVTGPGLLLVLLFLPGGFAQGAYQMRDGFLRWVANRHDILVPSLVADRRVEAATEDKDVISAAEHKVEETDSFDALAEPSITCPVCDETISISQAPGHEHLRRSGAKT